MMGQQVASAKRQIASRAAGSRRPSCKSFLAGIGRVLLGAAEWCYHLTMSKIKDIEKAVETLASDELAQFRAWFDAFDAARFDERIERDIHDGKLDQLAKQAVAAHRAGRTTEL
jgi:hypothetical protein